MGKIQAIKEGTAYEENVSQLTLRDPIRHEPIVDATSVAGGNISVSGNINFGPRGAGILGIVVGQVNTTDPDGAGPLTGTEIAAWTATITIYDKDDKLIGSAITQTIPATPSGTSVWTQLNVAQQVALRAQRLTITGTIVAPALTTFLRVYFTEQAPGINVSFDAGDNVAQETGGNLAAIAGKTPALGQALAAASVPVVLPALQQSNETAANTARTTATMVRPVQVLDALGNVVGASAGMPFNPTHHSPDDFTATRTDDDTIALAAGPATFTSANTLVAYVTKRVTATGVVTTYINGTNGVSLYIGADNTLEMIGATVAATDTILSVGVRLWDKENTKTTNSKRTEEIAPLDMRAINYNDLGANFDVADASVKYVSSGGVAPTWYDTHSLNAGSGKAKYISAIVTCTVLAGDTAHFWMIASNDSVNAGASKRYAEAYASGVGTGEEIYLKNGVEIGVAEGVMNSITWTNGTAGTVTYTFTVNIDNFNERYFDFGCGAVGGQIDNWYVDVAYHY